MRSPTLPLLLVAAVLPATGQIYLDFNIDDITAIDKRFTLELRQDLTPRAVASIIGLIKGTRKWVDAETGDAIRDTNFYKGQIIYKVRSEFLTPPFESAIWLGSQSGLDLDGLSDGAGYYFQDEYTFPPSGTANIVFLENDGPHTNGSRILITSSLNGVNFYPDLVPIGTVAPTSPPAEPGEPIQSGRNNILAFTQTMTDAQGKPVDDLTITDIAIRRVGFPATQFNELDPDWNLPEVGGTKPFIARIDDQYFLRFSAAPGSWGFYRTSFDLQDWGPANSFYQEPADPFGVDITDTVANTPKMYLRATSVFYPTSPSSEVPLPDARYQFSFTNQTSGSIFLQLDFNEDGDGGTWQKLNPPVAAGSLTLVEPRFESPYTNTLTISGTNGLPNFFFRIHHDINAATGAPLSPSRLDGFEWTEVEIIPGLFSREPVTNSEFPYLSTSSEWVYFPAP